MSGPKSRNAVAGAEERRFRSAAVEIHFNAALVQATTARLFGRPDLAIAYLERAHLLAQHRFSWHFRTHWRLLGLAHVSSNGREIAGQWFRLTLVPLGHFAGHLPSGNVGTTRMGPFETAPLPADIAALVPGMEPRTPLRLWLALALLVVILDQGTKALIVHALPLGAKLAITPFFNLVHAYNRGAAFGMLANAGGFIAPLLVLIGVLVSLWLVKEMATNHGRGHENAGFALILGGAIGNTWDRVRRGAVTDFLDFHWYQSHWPAFNLADVALNLGVLLLIVELFRRRRTPVNA